MFFEYPFTSEKFRRLLDSLDILYKDFALTAKCGNKSWVSQKLSIKNSLSFSASSRILLGYALHRYNKLNENLIIEDSYKNDLKAELLDQLMEEMGEVLKIGAHAPNLKKLHRK